MANICPKHDVLGDICWCCEQEKKKAAQKAASQPVNTQPKTFSNPNA